MTQRVLGVDIGTYESKGVLADLDGNLIAHASVQHDMIVPRPGWAEHRADADWWNDFRIVTRDLLQRSAVDPHNIACVAASAIGPCMLPVDASGRPLMNAVLYGVDTRSDVEVSELTRRIGSEAIMATCGNALTSQSVGPKILWLRRNRPEIFSAAAKFMTSTSYLTMKLTGECVIDHYTAANFSPVYDVNRQCWSTEIADDICSIGQLPELRWSTEIAGRVTADAACETGLAEGTPVAVGTIDAAAEAVGVGVQDPGDMMLMYGSTVFMIQLVERKMQDSRLWYAPWLYPGSHASMAGLATSGTLTRWFRSRFARELPNGSAFEKLSEEAAESPPGSNGLLLLPHFSGERSPIHDPDAKGVLFGLNLTHTRGDIYRALIEGIAYGTAHVLEAYRDIGATPVRVLAVGGGTKNPIWLQSMSDIGRVRQHVCRNTIGASLGDAFLGACAVGAAQPSDIVKWNPVAEIVEPDCQPVHERQFELFKQLYSRTRDISHALGGEKQLPTSNPVSSILSMQPRE